MLRTSLTLAALSLVACGRTTLLVGPVSDARVTADVAIQPDGAAQDATAVLPDTGVGPDATPDARDATPAGPDVLPVADVILPPGTPDYTQPGPLNTAATNAQTVTLPSSTGCGNLCRVSVVVTYPTAGAAGRAAPYPVVILSNGFQVPASQYESYARRLSSWGYVVLRWDVVGENVVNAVTHTAGGNMVVELLSWLDTQNTAGSPLVGLVDGTRVMTAGHSRGGKFAVLAATRSARIDAVFGVDPVDSAPPGVPASGNYPSAVSALRLVARSVPFALVGAERGGDGLVPCAPRSDNFAQFFDAARSPALEAVIRDTGHMQFLDSRMTCGVTCLACINGGTSDVTVRSVTQTLMVAWAERHLRGLTAQPYLDGTWLQSNLDARVFTEVNRK